LFGLRNWVDACGVSGVKVLPQVNNTFDDDGLTIQVDTKLRAHDYAGTGELSGSSGSGSHDARVYHMVMYHDLAGRQTDSVDVGTGGSGVGDSYSRPGSPEARSDTALRTTLTYGGGGWLETVTDPRGLVTKHVNDMLGRETKSIEA